MAGIGQDAAESDASSQDAYLAIDTSLGPDAVTLLSLDGEDAMSRCFLYQVTVASAHPEEAVESLLGKSVTLWLLNNDSERRRPISGHIRRIVSLNATLRGSPKYRFEIVPRLWFLSCTSDCRIFQHQSVPDILQTVFQDQGLLHFEFRIEWTNYPSVEYCVQYQETALDFASRLMEHLGLFYWHEHSAGRHLLVIADRNAATSRCNPFMLKIAPDNVFGDLRSIGIDNSFRPGKWTLNDYDFESPTKLLLVNTPTLADVPQMADHEIYEYPGNFADPDTGRQLTRMRIEMEEAQLRKVFGTGTCASFFPGCRFETADRTGAEKPYLLTQVRHSASWPGFGNSEARECQYENSYTAIPAAVPYRPERLTPRPFVHGTQTATVVGPAGESIYCDEFGRVRVQFHWDRRGRRNENSSCWMRVAQARSGAHYGTLVIPHVGHEVLISFIEGNPDRPVINGTVPNALTMPPADLPVDKHKTVQRDHGDNKIVMHGKAGKERLSMVSPRAVNLFASGQTAKPLSATLSFSSNPQDNQGSVITTTTGTSLSWSTPTAVTSTGTFVIDEYQDPLGLSEVYNEWFGTTQSDTDNGANLSTSPNSGAAVNSEGTFGTQDGDPSTSFLNWGSEGKINCVVLDNNNLWVYKNSNSWINGNVNTQINGNSTTVIGGEAYSGTNNNVVSATTVWGTSNTQVYGPNLSTVFGDNTSTVLATNQSFVFGLNLSVNLGLAITANDYTFTNTGIEMNTSETKVTTTSILIRALATAMIHSAPVTVFG